MKKGEKFKKIFEKLKGKGSLFLVLYVILFCGTAALFTYRNSAPDEELRYDIVKYVSENLQIPSGDDPAVRNSVWGFSYAFQPITSQILAGLVMRGVTTFTDSYHIVIFSARFINIVWILVYAFFVLKISRKLFKKGIYRTIFVIITTLTPQVLYIGSYINNDAMAMASVAMVIYAWLIGIEKKWNYKTCILLAVGIGLLMMSYYNAYGYILASMILFFGVSIVRKVGIKEVLKKSAVIIWIVFMLAGWWFIRSAVLYNGDMLGLKTAREYSEKYAMSKSAEPMQCVMAPEGRKKTLKECSILSESFKPSERDTSANKGETLGYMLYDREWTKNVRHSFYGNFGYMNLPMHFELYEFYEIMVGIGLFGVFGYLIYRLYLRIYKKKKEKEELEPVFNTEMKLEKEEKRLLYTAMIFGAVTVVGLSIYYSFFLDFQPQGRYILPIMIPVMFFAVKGLEFILKDLKGWLRNIILGIFIAVFIFTPLFELFAYILPNLTY